MEIPLATIPNTEVLSLSSSIVEQEYRIYIALPFDHETAAERYPVLYISDANGMFGIVTETVRMLQLFQEVPQMVIVGVGYPVNDFRGALGLRNRDLTPTEDGHFLEEQAKIFGGDIQMDGTGRAGVFLRFIREELKPFIEKNYRVDDGDSAIFGHSFGGLFSLYTLLHAPDTFQRYIISSPSIWWDRDAVFEYEAVCASKHSDLAVRVFISAGELEESMPAPFRDEPARFVTNMQEMARRLQNRGYESLALTQHVFEGESHMSGAPGAISRGLRVVFGADK